MITSTLQDNWYIGQSATKSFKRGDLATAVVTNVEEAVLDKLQLKSADSAPDTTGLIFVAANNVTQVLGGLRYSSAGSVEYCDNLAAADPVWTPISAAAAQWKAHVTYEKGTLIQYAGAWYKASNDIPASSAVPAEPDSGWQLATLGSVYTYVRNASELVAALANSNTSECALILRGDFVFSGETISTASKKITIYSDALSTVQGSVSFIGTADTNIYWYSSGTAVPASMAIAVNRGILWIRELCVDPAAALALNAESDGTIYYQHIAGGIPHVAGSVYQQYWDGIDNEAFVPRELAELPQLSLGSDIALSDTIRVYVTSGEKRGYMYLSDLYAYIGATAITYAHIDEQGTGELPIASKVPAGYTFYNTDTGYVYVRLHTGVWSEGAYLRGPQGKPGLNGKPGLDGEPGEDGAPASITIGEVTALDTGALPYAHVTEGSNNTYILSLGLPKGNTGIPGPPTDLQLGSVQFVDSVADAAITIDAPSETVRVLNLSIPRGTTPVLSIGSVDTVDSASDAGVTIDTTDAAAPVLNFTLPRGASSYDIWKNEYGTDTSTIADYLDAIGIGSRFMPFTAAQVAEDGIVVFDTAYPAIAVVDNTGAAWSIPSGAVLYDAEARTASVNITWILEALELTASPAYITTEAGNFYRDAERDMTYTDEYGVSELWYAWADIYNTPIYTDTEIPEIDLTVAYAYPLDTSQYNSVVSAYIPVREASTISGEWRVAFGGGGGGNPHLQPIRDIGSVTDYTVHPGIAVRWKLSAASTLRAVALDPSLIGNTRIYIEPSGYTLAFDNITNTGNIDITPSDTAIYVCDVTWYNESARLKVIDVI